MKLKFAHQLRAVAALAVVLYHYWGIFFSPVVTSLIGVPTSFAVEQPGYARHMLSPGFGGLLYGVFGVGVFFLISGFVIPISLRGLSTGEFLVRRFFRIYPVYWLCLLISLAMYFVCSWYWSTPLSGRINLHYLVSNIPLLHSATGMPSLDFVCWSLGVEVKFYMVFALILLFGRRAHQVMTLVAALLALCCLAAYFTTHGSGLESFFSHLISDTRFMTFMFLGCLFYYVLYDELTVRAALAYGIVIYALFLTISAFYEATVFGPLAKNYTYALALFSVCYLLRKRFRDNKVIDFVADISFPLYLVHSTIGYVTMPILIDKGIPYTLAWMLCLGLALFVAFIVHRYVEVPVNALGKRITNFRSPWSAKPTPGADLAG